MARGDPQGDEDYKVKKHEQLGMTLDFQTPGNHWVTVVYYLKGVLEDFPELIIGRNTSP